MNSRLLAVVLPLTLLSFGASRSQAEEAGTSDYVVVVSAATNADPEWSKVVAALVERHGASVLVFDDDMSEVLPELTRRFPRFTCFVAKPAESGREAVARVHQLTRRMDDDPYADTLWSILTGYDAECALRIARHADPLTVRKVASGTEVALEMCHEGVWYDELEKHKTVSKRPGGEPVQQRGPGDTTKALAETLTDYQADLFVTSGHATERNWMIGFSYRNGRFQSEDGRMYGVDTSDDRFAIVSDNPKVYLPIGNCLMGHVDGTDAMALAWMNSCGVRQMIGYTVPTWFGYSGWGCLDYFVEQPGRYTFVEAFHANQHALMHALIGAEETKDRDARGLRFDRDVVALYGDPKWVARMAEAPCAYDQRLSVEDDIHTLTITPRRGADSFQPVNTNGSQRGWRPIVAFLPNRIGKAEVLSGADLNPTITDNFVLVPNPRRCDPNRVYEVEFRAAAR